MKKRTKIAIILIVLITIVFIFLLLKLFINDIKNSFNKPTTKIEQISENISDKKINEDSLFILLLDSIESDSNAILNKLSGNKVTISVTGLDTRINASSPHADANHLINIWLDSGVVEVVSVPRGTFVELGYSDSSGLNYLANVRSTRGQETYLKYLKRICEVDTINYHIEFGLSQAIGILELIGFKANAVQTLRMLRSRKAFNIGDYQRAYNQGQFIGQMIYDNFNKMKGISGEILLRGLLFLVDGNLKYDNLKQIINRLESHGFPKDRKHVFVRLKPKLSNAIVDYDFGKKEIRDSLYNLIVKKSPYSDSAISDKKPNYCDGLNKRVLNRINPIIKSAVADTAKNPSRAIAKLNKIFKQKVWLQITDTATRSNIRNKIYYIIIDSYNKLKNKQQATIYKNMLNAEMKIFNY